jgi:hypothetical protein
MFRRIQPFFQYVRATQMPTPGAMEYGFESEMLADRPFIGPAMGARSYMRTVTDFGTGGQSYQAVALNWFTGLGGLAHGQSALQPLSNPYGS